LAGCQNFALDLEKMQRSEDGCDMKYSVTLATVHAKQVLNLLEATLTVATLRLLLLNANDQRMNK